MPAINLSFFQGLWARLGERWKLLLVALVAFILGTFWGGRHGTSTEAGRFVPASADGVVILDTHTGEVWVWDEATHAYKRKGAPPHGWF